MNKSLMADPFGAFSRYTLGFDDLFRDLETISQPSGYPPYNLIREEDGRYRIEVAVAGFTEEELIVEYRQGILSITTTKQKPVDLTAEEEIKQMQVLAGIEPDAYIHRGIARREFSLRFRLNESIEIAGAKLQHGILTVNLETVTTEDETTRIKIKAS